MNKPEAGKILIAMPMLGDPNFVRSVVLLCEHSAAGSFGLVLNQSTGNFVSEVIDEINGEFPLYIGGLVEQNTLHFIHRLGHLIHDSVDLGNGLFWSGDFEKIKSLINVKLVNQDNIRFFIGYSGWGSGQLTDELTEKAWTVAPAEIELIFEKNIDKFWRNTLLKLGGNYKQIANYPIDSKLN